MAKNLKVDNLMLTKVITFKPPTMDEPKKNIGLCCAWEGCGERIYRMNGYLIIDGMAFCSDTCAAEHYMKDAGGRRVYGGAC